jgi:prepilin signal peptidase PulO-like enzyme (type II secretory pathway)
VTNACLAIAIAGSSAAAIVDARTGLIPDRLSGCAAGGTLVVAGLTGTLAPAAAGAAAVAGSLLLLFVATRGRGLGFGDVKLGVTIGAGCGAATGMLALGAAFVCGALYAVALLVSGRARPQDAIPFAPFLAAGTLAAAAVRHLVW